MTDGQAPGGMGNLGDIPLGDDGRPVFGAPWEASAFALAVRLSGEGHFTWDEWAATLSEEIRSAQREGDPDLGDTYYRHWLRTLERLCRERGPRFRRGGVRPQGGLAQGVPQHTARQAPSTSRLAAESQAIPG